MNSKSVTHPTVQFLLRHYVELLTVLAVLFVFQTGLVPFDFERGPIKTGSNAWFGVTITHLTFPDIVSNIFLYVPVGIFLHWSLVRLLPRAPFVFLIAIALATALSGTVEWLQAYSPVRVSSIIDFVSNITGAAVGVSLSWTARRIVPHMLGAAIVEFHERPRAALLKAYCCLLVVFAAVPFSFSFDGIRLKQAIRSANLVPFRAPAVDNVTANNPLVGPKTPSYEHAQWLRMKRWSRWAAESAAFAVLAWLIHAVLRTDYRFSRRTTILLILYLGGSLAVALSILQLPIVSRACDVTDVLFRLLGLILGLIASSTCLRTGGHLRPERQAQRWHGVAKIGFAATVGYILYTSVIPLTFGTQTGGLGASVANERFLPFFAYFLSRFDLMMADAMEKFASYVVFAALLATFWTRAIDLKMSSRVLMITVLGVSLSALMEIVQAFIPVRVMSLTDPILAAAGCLTGVLAQRHAVTFYHFATSQALPRPDAAPRRPESFAGLPLPDALIATLMDPKADAPVERTPKTPRPHPHRRS